MPLKQIFSFFGDKVTKKFLYLHKISVLIKIKDNKLSMQ